MAIVTRTFLDKSNSIIYGDSVNLGLNPILELYYGISYSRGLIHFDVEKLKELVENKTYPDISKIHHRLKMYNVASLRTQYTSRCNIYNNAVRAKSFDLRFFTIDRPWDMGGGFDYLKDGYDTVNRIYSTDGSNWFNSKNNYGWSHSGIFNEEEMIKHTFAIQHFDIGNECIDVDITDIVNNMILGKIENNGIGIAFTNDFETIQDNEDHYVGFFTDHTHTFYHPYIETTYEETIDDDRADFFLDKDNKLYFYASVGSQMVNLDELPVCTINGAQKAVKQATKGIYYIDINMSSSEYEPETMFYDTWSNLKYNGRVIPDQELYFTTKAPDEYFHFGMPFETKKQEKIVPSLFGINHKERIFPGDIRKINVIGKIAYTSRQESAMDGVYYRLYSITTELDEVDVIDWRKVERGYNENFFYINTKELIPGRYFIDIKIDRDIEETIYTNICEFYITDNKDITKI